MKDKKKVGYYFMSQAKVILKKALVGACVVGVLISTDAMAQSKMVSVPFTKAKVDSNEFTTVAKVVKEQESQFAYVTVDQIYKADGSSSNYQRINEKVQYKKGDKWIMCDSIKNIRKGEQAKFEIPKLYRTAGNKLRFRGMGNDPSLDCKISGHFDTY